MQIPGGFELILVLAVVILLFGAKKIPELAKGLGTGLKEFRKSVKDDPEEEVSDSKDPEQNKKVDNQKENKG
ncbi:MAG: Sec-independent protein translocase subunit TatA/TatB [Chitinivibrionales bacterium]